MSVNPNLLAIGLSDVMQVHVERPELFYGGFAMFAAGTTAAFISARRWRDEGNNELEAQLYPDPDQQAAVAEQYTERGRASAITWSFLGAAAFMGMAHLSRPYIQSDSYSAHEIGIVIEAGADSRAKDVEDSDSGEATSRLEASLVSALDLVDDFDGNVRVNIVLAGTYPESMGTISNSEDAITVLDNAANYMQVFENAGEPDIRAGIAIAEASSPEKVVVFTQDESAQTMDAIRDKAEQVVAISTGKPGTPYTFLGQEHFADYTNVFNEVNAEVAISTDEIQGILTEEITDKVVVEGKKPLRGLKNIALISAAFASADAVLKRLIFPRKKGKE